jgi:dCTP deaminase
MILTGPAIASAVEAGEIVIEPYEADRVSTNAYDWRLGDRIQWHDGALDAAVSTPFTEVPLPPKGLVLQPHRLYLGVTHERTYSDRYAQMINGNHEIGGLGIWVHVSAPLGHVGHAIRWTLEIRVARPVRVYPHMTFGKIIFLTTRGPLLSYQDVGRKYTVAGGIDISRLHEEFE